MGHKGMTQKERKSTGARERRLLNEQRDIFIKYLLATQKPGVEINPRTWPEPALTVAREYLREHGFL